MTTRTIDLTPTWREAATILIAVLEDGTPDGKANARAELIRMAELLDRVNENQRQEAAR